MENVFEISYVGTPSEIMRYIRSFIPNCEICNDTGFYEATEWSGTDDSYDITKKCICQDE